MTALIFAFANPGAEGGGNPLTMFIPIILVFIVFYLLLIRPQQKKQREHKALLEQLGKGDKVVTNGGLYGTISDTKEHIVILRIAENVKVEVVKSAIATVIEKKKE